MRIRNFFSTLNYAISILNNEGDEDIVNFETNFNSIMRNSIDYIRMIVDERKDELDEDWTVDDIVLDDYTAILDDTYHNTDVSLIAMKYIATKYLNAHKELIPELEKEIEERQLVFSEEETYTDNFHENLLTALLGIKKDYEDNFEGIEELPGEISEIVDIPKKGGSKEEAFKKLNDIYGNAKMLPFAMRRQLMVFGYYAIFGIQGIDDEKITPNSALAKAKKSYHIKDYIQTYLERIEPVFKEEVENSILSMVYQLDRFGEISEKIEIHNERMRRCGLPGLGYHSDINPTYKGLPDVQTLMRKENLSKLSIDALLRMNSFYNNRFAKILSEYSMSLFVIANLDATQRCVDGEDITRESLTPTQLSTLVTKYQTLILPVKAYYTESQNDIEENPYDYIDSANKIELTEGGRVKNQVVLNIDEFVKKLSGVWGRDYKKYFDERLPDVDNRVESDAYLINTLYNPVFLSYRFKHRALQSEYAYLHFLSKEQPGKSLNFGIVLDSDEKENPNSILLASDGGVNLSNRLHTFKRPFKDFLISYTGSPLVRIYEGFNDFYACGEYISSQLLLPNCKEHARYIKALKSGRLPEDDKISRKNIMNEKFIEHIEYCMDSSKFMPSRRVPKTKVDKKGKVVTEHVQPIRYLDLSTGKKYVLQENGKLVDKDGTVYGEDSENIRGIDE